MKKPNYTERTLFALALDYLHEEQASRRKEKVASEIKNILGEKNSYDLGSIKIFRHTNGGLSVKIK